MIKCVPGQGFGECALCPLKNPPKPGTISGEKVPFYTSPRFGFFLCVLHLVELYQREQEDQKKQDVN